MPHKLFSFPSCMSPLYFSLWTPTIVVYYEPLLSVYTYLYLLKVSNMLSNTDSTSIVYPWDTLVQVVLRFIRTRACPTRPIVHTAWTHPHSDTPTSASTVRPVK